MFEFANSFCQACSAHPFIASGAGASLAILAFAPFALIKASTRRKIALAISADEDLLDWIGGEAYIYICNPEFIAHIQAREASAPKPMA